MLRRVRSETELRVTSPKSSNRHSSGHRSLKGHATSREDVVEHRRSCRHDFQREITNRGQSEEYNQPDVTLCLGSPASITSGSSTSLTSPKSAPVITSNISYKRLQFDVTEKLYLTSTGESRPVRLKNLHSSPGEAQRESLQRYQYSERDGSKLSGQYKDVNGNDTRHKISNELRKSNLKASTSKMSPLTRGHSAQTHDRLDERNDLSRLNPSISEELGKKVSDWLAGLDEDASRRYARKQMAGSSHEQPTGTDQ